MVAHERLEEFQAHETHVHVYHGGNDGDPMPQSTSTRAYPEVVLANEIQVPFIPFVPLKEREQHLYQKKTELNVFLSSYVQ